MPRSCPCRSSRPPSLPHLSHANPARLPRLLPRRLRPPELHPRRRGARSRGATASWNTTARSSSRSTLYEKKCGGELVGQLFDFVDKGERHVRHAPGDDADAGPHGRGAGARFQKAAQVVLRPAILPLRKAAARTAARVLPAQLRHHRRSLAGGRCGADRGADRHPARLRPRASRTSSSA